MKKIQSSLPIALPLVFALVACTRPISQREPAGGLGTQSPLAVTLAPASAHIPEDTQTPEAKVPDSTSTAPVQTQAIETQLTLSLPVRQISLTGPIASPQAEISGMAWYGDVLILLPQYPNRFSLDGAGSPGSVFALHKSDILDYLQDKTKEPLRPFQISFSAPNLEKSIRGFEGFEAIAIDGDRVYLTIEASPSSMMGYLIAGQIAPDLSRIDIDVSRLSQIPPQTGLPNFSDEALLVFGSRLISIYEISGSPFLPNPVAHMFDFSLQLQDTLAFPDIPYRISDVTSPDDSGRFWAINFTLRSETGVTPVTDSSLDGLFQFQTLERLVEFQFNESGIVLSDAPLFQLEPISDQESSNWEAIARLDGMGFLLATDEHPDTILGFVLSP